MMTITTKSLWTRRGVRWARGDLPMLLLLACLGPPLVVSQGGHDVMAATSFSCIGKVIGGYYADVEAGCQMFHVCTLNEKAKVHDYTFRCLAGTVFDQETRVCERTDEVDCSRSRSFYYLNNDLYGPGIIPSTAHIRVIDEGEETQRMVGPARIADITTMTTTTPAPRSLIPETSFSCVDKIIGGLYADVELNCAVFHICSVEPNAGVKDNKFECGRGTLFDQSTRTCQTAALVDCAAAPSLYYLNDHRNLPDDSSIDLCRSRALGSPLADITTGCQYYTVCQAGEGGKLVESRVACKKDFLFSQLQKRCVSTKKVDCAKETLSEIMGLGGRGEGRGRKRRMASILQSRRFRRAALAPLVNLVTAPGVEDVRVRRALYNLATLQQWTLENARQSTFIEVYALHTNGAKNHYPKKLYLDTTPSWDSSEAGHEYQNIQRKKRDVTNITVTELVTHDHSSPEDLSQPEQTHPEQINLDITHSFSSSIVHPTIVTTTIGQRTNTLSTSTVLGQRGSSTTNPATPPLPPVIPTTLSTYTVSPSRTSTTTVTVTPITPVTVTVTTTKIITTATDLPPDLFSTSTSIATATTQSPESVTTPLPETSSTLTGLEADDKTATTPSSQITSSKDASGDSGIHTTKPTETETSTVPIPVPQEESPEDSIKTTTEATGTSQSSVASEGEAHEASKESVTESAIDGLVEPQESPVDTSAAVTEGNETSMSMSTTEVTQSSEVSAINSTTTTITTTTTNSTPVTPEDTTPKLVQNTTITTPINATTASSTTESSGATAPSGSINVSTTGTPDDVMSASGNISTTPSTESSVTPQGPFTSENLPKTNFTCKGKKLEQFYPDPEANCQVFHYCSPGFVKKQVLDLKFLCTGATMFDVETQKCEDMSSVTCGQEPTPPPPPPPANTTTTPEGTTVAPHDAAQNETNTTTVSVNVTSEVMANVTDPTILLSATIPSNTSELLNVTTDVTTVVNTLESTTVSQLNVTTEKETNWNVTESEHHKHVAESEHHKNITTESEHHKNATESEHHTDVTESEHHTNVSESEHHTNVTEPEHHTNVTESEHHKNVTESEHHKNVTESEHHKNATESKDKTIEAKVTTEESIQETTTITEDHHLTEPDEKTAEIDQPESTTVKATEEPASESEAPTTEVATEEGTKDEIITATESYEDVLFTSLSPQEVLVPEISTELGPFIHPEVVEETKSIAEEVTQVHASTEMNIDSASDITTLDPSMSVLQETSTEVSVSTDVSVFSSSDSISSESSMSSAVSVSSHNITTSSSVKPVEASV